MKIYDTTGIHICDISEGISKGVFLIDYDGELDFNSLIEINGTYYRARSLKVKEQILSVEEIDLVEGSEVGDTEYGYSFVCPFCGEEYEDAFELSEDSGKTNCVYCHASLEYSKEVEINYTVQLLSGPQVVKVN